ncbi:hypothetical protein Fmac_015584 [Flemingia macrophylla]|uniref:Uncharacterized protein n=1 Tax=Flemingia macrophylla TaxID=520843 RepID=A0ABD1MF31_9FABA
MLHPRGSPPQPPPQLACIRNTLTFSVKKKGASSLYSDASTARPTDADVRVPLLWRTDEAKERKKITDEALQGIDSRQGTDEARKKKKEKHELIMAKRGKRGGCSPMGCLVDLNGGCPAELRAELRVELRVVKRGILYA